MIEMKACPTCGSLLTAKLVDATLNPMRDESCPKTPRRKITETKVKSKKVLKKQITVGQFYALADAAMSRNLIDE